MVTQIQNSTDEDNPSASFPSHDFQSEINIIQFAEHDTSYEGQGQKESDEGSDAIFVAISGPLWRVAGI